METVFSRAADVIRQKGHYPSQEPDYGACAMLAISDALGEATGLVTAAHETFMRHIGASTHDDAFDWNDERSAEDVLIVLKELHVEAGGS